MRSYHSVKKLMGTGSMVALLVGLAAVPARQASAQAGLYGGGSSSSSLYFRQLLDCYDAHVIGGSGAILPSLCTSPASGAVEGLYASVGSLGGQAAFISDDPTQLVTAGGAMPYVPPPYLDGSTGASFNTYPYAELDFATSDMPLPAVLSALTNSYGGSPPWVVESPPGISTFHLPTVSNGPTVAYSTAAYGNPIQLPAFEAPVALAVNTIGMIVQSAGQQGGAATAPGNAIQLDTAQVCAIFAGAVTDWSSTRQIAKQVTDPFLGTVITSEAFNAANVNTVSTTPVAYSPGSLPIHVIYRSDGSGTSFIITNYLKSNCPQLDDGTNNYAAIFGAANLPSTTFANLISNIIAAGGAPVNFTGEAGTAAVASTVNNDAAHAGAIGYIGNDFTAAFSSLSTAPLSASIQDEAEMENGINLPSDETFPAPTPANADNAFAPLAAMAPGIGAAYAEWNVYGKMYSGGTLGGKSILGVPDAVGAYPIVGTTFLLVYSCYTSGKIAKVTNFLDWYYNAAAAATGPKPAVLQVLGLNGFAPLTSSWSAAVVSSYLTSTAAGAIRQGNTAGTSCAGVPGA